MVGTCLPFIRSCRNNFARHSEKSKKRKTEKRWEDIIRERTGLELAKFQRAVENRQKWRKLIVESFVVPQCSPPLPPAPAPPSPWLRDR